jgi:EmrB/QacA subfamily drug resistance transporter
MAEKIPARVENIPSTVPKPAAPAQGQQPSSHARIGGKQLVILFILSLTLAIIIIDTTIVSVALPTIQSSFAVSVNDLEWISSLYALIFGAFILTWGKLSDQYGRRRILMMGIGLFVTGSTITGLSNGLGIMLVGRAIQGFGAAMAMPSTLSILSVSFVGRARALAFGIWGATAGATGAIGPILGGYFVTYVTWRWAFLINIPIGIVALVGALAVIQETRYKDPKYKTDFGGIILIALSLSALIFGFIEGQTYGWLTESQAFTIGSFTWPFTNFSIAAFSLVSGSILLISFIAYELRMQRLGKDPLFDFSLFRNNRGFSMGNLTVLIVAMGEFGVLFFLSIYLQEVRDLSAINTGVTMLPLAITAFFLAPLAGAAANKIGPKWIVTLGMCLEAVGLYSLWQVITISNPIWYLYPVLAVYGAGVGLAIGQLTNTVLATVPWQKAGAGSGINNTLRQVGSAFGVAVIGAVLVSILVSVGKADLAASTVIPDSVKTALTGVLNSGLSGGVSGHPEGTGALAQAIGHVFDDAITQGTKWAAFTAGVFVSLGAVCSLFIPNTKNTWGGGGGDSASSGQGQQGQWGGQQQGQGAGQGGQQWGGQQQGQQGSWGGQPQTSGGEKPKSQDPSQKGGDNSQQGSTPSSSAGQQQGSWGGQPQGQQQNQQWRGPQGQGQQRIDQKQGSASWGGAQKPNNSDEGKQKEEKPSSDSN